MTLLSRQELLEGFADLATELRQRGVHAKLFLVGGAAMALGYDARRTTDDVDVLSVPSAAVMDAAHAVALRRGWARSWLDDGARVFAPDLEEAGTVVIEGDSLEVVVGSPRYLLAMKLFAARSDDLADARALAVLAGIQNAAQAEALVENAYRAWFARMDHHEKGLIRRQAVQRRRQIKTFITEVFA